MNRQNQCNLVFLEVLDEMDILGVWDILESFFKELSVEWKDILKNHRYSIN